MIIVLDEIDQSPPKERNAILYNLLDLPLGGLVCICNSEHVYFDLEERAQSRLNPVRILFHQYSPEEIFSILDRRAQHALSPGVYTKDLLRTIACLKNTAKRSVAKPCLKDGELQFWRHLGAYLKMMYLAHGVYLHIRPTWVFTEDGVQIKSGPTLGRLVIRWTGAERNLNLLYHIRFWTGATPKKGARQRRTLTLIHPSF